MVFGGGSWGGGQTTYELTKLGIGAVFFTINYAIVSSMNHHYSLRRAAVQLARLGRTYGERAPDRRAGRAR